MSEVEKTVKKIEIWFVNTKGGEIIIEMDGEILPTEEGYLSLLGQEILWICMETAGFKNNVIGITAWDGGIAKHPATPPPSHSKPDELVRFKKIILQKKLGGYTKEPHLVQAIHPSLARIWWHKSPHFRQIGATGQFECLVCRTPNFGVSERDQSTGEILTTAPSLCSNETCYSHFIENMED